MFGNYTKRGSGKPPSTMHFLTINVIDQRLSHRIAHHQTLANDSVAAVVIAIRLTIFLECPNNARKDLMVDENS